MAESRIRLQIEVSADEVQAIDDAMPKARTRNRVDFVRRALDIYQELLTVRERGGDILIIQRDGVRRNFYL